MNFEYLTLEDPLAGDLGMPKVQDLGLLDPATRQLQSSLIGRDAYGGLDEKAAVLLESIVRHPLIDGNKPLGWVAAFVFHGLNGIDWTHPRTTPTTWSSASPPVRWTMSRRRGASVPGLVGRSP